MKRLVYLLFVFAILMACQDEDAFFDVGLKDLNVTFKPIAGGAIMHYKLPDNDEVFRLKVCYTDAEGNEIMRVGSYACDSLVIVGFNEARENVAARVTLCNRQNVESNPVEVTFSTLDSGPIAFFKEANVTPFWNGFMLTYNGVPEAKGMAHVFYLGENPLTHEPDTLQVGSFIIGEDRDTISCIIQAENAVNTVIIRTEDYRGYRVKQQVWEKVESYSYEKLTLTASSLKDPNEVIIEDNKMGVEYLFDGDINGEKAFKAGTPNNKEFYTFLAGPDAVGKPFIIDMGEDRVPAFIRIYSMLYVRTFPWFAWQNPYWAGRDYMYLCPCNVSVYASNDQNDDASWVKIGGYEEVASSDYSSRWCVRCPGLYSNYRLESIEDVLGATPAYIEIPFAPSAENFQYLKLVVNATFLDDEGQIRNKENYVTFNELEVYAKTK